MSDWVKRKSDKGGVDYTPNYYKWQRTGSRASANEVVPLILELAHPRSVVDVGCGIGTWLSVFVQHGIEDILGIDGPYIDTNLLEIEEKRFLPHDLRKPLKLERQFDLALSLEVAEHLPKQHAKPFVETLTHLSPVVVFSAAIPFQGGPNHHNEQWPEYWAELFAKQGWVVVDALRERIWNNKKIEWWYRQNILIFIREESLINYPLIKERKRNDKTMLSLVHPQCFLESVSVCPPEIFKQKRYS